jgi:hypothetical protein
MRRLMIVAGMLLVLTAATAQAQQTFDLGAPLSAEWEGAANEAAAGVTEYQVRVDTAAWTASGQAVPQATYRAALTQSLLTLGAHTVSIRACAGVRCGAELSASFTIDRPLPGQPRNPRIILTPTTAVLTVPQAVDRANAYALLLLDRTLTQEEMNTLAVRHGPGLPTRESVLRVLDDSFAQFVVRP